MALADDIDVTAIPPFIAGSFATADLQSALSWAATAVEAYCERSFSAVADDVVVLDPFGNHSAQLPNPPVTAVSLVEGYMPRNDGTMAWQTLTAVNFNERGLLWDTSADNPALYQPWPLQTWPTLPNSLRVTYSHGYADPPQAVIDAAVKAAAIYLANPFNLVERRAGDVTFRWSDRDRVEEIFDALIGQYRLVSIP